MDKRIKVGLIGLGQRGNGLMNNILKIKDTLISAICDKFSDRLDNAEKRIVDNGDPAPFKTDDYLKVIACGVDVVIVATSWNNHVEVALSAMNVGVPVAMEVGGSHSIEDCWALVDCYEKTNTPFFFLENCCYNIDEALATSLVRNGVLGEVVYCQGAYCHDLRSEIAGGIDTHHYRLEEYKNYCCDNYPTHELGPISKILNINRGNRFIKLVSMSSKSLGMKHYIKNTPIYADRLKDIEFKQGDVVSTMIQCENGEMIVLKLDTTLPRLYDRNLTVSGTKGFYCQSTNAVVLDKGEFDHEIDKYSKAFGSDEKYNKYLPEEWRAITDEQKKAGHGGMDYIMLRHLFDVLKTNEKKMPIDVYDAAVWMSITALSEKSIKEGSMPVDCIDFTRGKYKQFKPLDTFKYPYIRCKNKIN